MIQSNFSVEFSNRTGEGVIVPSELTFLPVRWKGASFGGGKEAEIIVTGGRAGIKALRNWLRYGVRIVNRRGANCWHGYIHDVELQLSGLAITASLDDLRNRIAVTYSSTVGAIETAATTAWASDAGSVAEYGTKEHLESLGSASVTMATAWRDRELAAKAWPSLKRAGDGGQGDSAAAILRCRGWFNTAGWKYYQRTDGRLEHLPNDTQEWPLGWGISSSNQIGFGGYGIHDAALRLEYLPSGAKVTVTGSTSNNKSFTFADATNEDVTTYTATSVRFEPSDDIIDTNEGMGAIKSDHWVYVSGSPLNTRWHYIGTAGADHIRTSATTSGNIQAESAGASITLTQAQRIDVYERATAEAPATAAGVNIALAGQQIAQKITLGYTMTIDRIQLELAKVGAPSDSVSVEISTNNAGVPGTLKTSGTMAAANLTDSLTSVWVTLTPVTLIAGDYWIRVKRSGSLNGADHFTLGMTKTAYGSCIAWNGSAWSAFNMGWYVRFRIWATEDTGTMIETILSAAGQFLTISSGFTTGVFGFTTMDQIAVAGDEISRLAEIGTATGKRVLLDVGPDRTVRLYAQTTPIAEETLLYYTANGQNRLTNSAGSDWEPGVLPLGRWVEFADLDSDLATAGGLSPAAIAEAEYNAASGQWTLTFDGERTLADLIKVQQG